MSKRCRIQTWQRILHHDCDVILTRGGPTRERCCSLMQEETSRLLILQQRGSRRWRKWRCVWRHATFPVSRNSPPVSEADRWGDNTNLSLLRQHEWGDSLLQLSEISCGVNVSQRVSQECIFTSVPPHTIKVQTERLCGVKTQKC